MSIKTRLLAGTSALAMAGSMMAFAAPAAHAAVVPVGTCHNLLAIGGAKSTTVGDGITDKDNQDVSISTKGVDPSQNKGTALGTCSFNSGLSTPNSAKPPVKGFSGTKHVIKWGTKLFSPESDCNTSDTTDNTEWPLNGTLSITFSEQTAAAKSEALTAAITVTGFSDPDNDPGTASDVVEFKGLVTKGVAAGADVAGQSEFDPIVKDKFQTSGPTAGPFGLPYYGYSLDIAGAGGCADATPANANITAFMNGSVANTSQILALPVSGITFTIGS